MIIVSEKARKRLTELMSVEDSPAEYVRIGVSAGGCSGLSYELGFDNKTLPSDQIFEHNGIKLLVDKKSQLYLIGTTLNYSGGLNGKGFVFENPNAS